MRFVKHLKISTNFQLYLAFTIAEVLIVLGIIGIIAEMTIPTLYANFQEQVAVTSLNKAYSELSQAFTSAAQENGTPDNWNLISSSSKPGAVNMLNKILPYIKIIKNCETDSSCTTVDNYLLLSGTDYDVSNNSSNSASAILADGSILTLSIRYPSCDGVRGTVDLLQSVCGILRIDINGAKPPNQLGIDAFYFDISKNGLIPHGTQQDTSFPFETNCVKATGQGYGCTAWVLYNHNMGYLHCNNLSWTGPTSCQ